jgi:23S rRNA pseudouridine2605 synthase
MRLNKFIALSTDLSRRAADAAIEAGRVAINGQQPALGALVQPDDVVSLDNKRITPAVKTTILLNKPAGYVCSRTGQGSRTIYDLLPRDLHHLKTVGRLDKESSGLLLLTNDGDLAQQLTHPSHFKLKVYEVVLGAPLQPLHRQMISDHGIMLEDGISRLQLDRLRESDDTAWKVMMHEGRNRQIRRTFAALGYHVQRLHRTAIGNYSLNDLPAGEYRRFI